MDREIGGYMGFECYSGRMLHEEAIKLNCGRNCLAYLIEAKNIQRIALPYWLCNSVSDLCKKYRVQIRFYHIGMDLKPQSVDIEEDEWLFLVNYYGQLSNDEIRRWKSKTNRIIVDNTQAYFQMPVRGVDTIYSCRKYFGVPDGAILYTDKRLQGSLDRSESFQHMGYLLGRFERTAAEFYQESVENNKRFAESPIQSMSLLTENLLRAVDYDQCLKLRRENYRFLHAKLKQYNQLHLSDMEGDFSYPLMISDAQGVRGALIRERVYVPVLWPNVVNYCPEDTNEYKQASGILPLPCDHRYTISDMQRIVDYIKGTI